MTFARDSFGEKAGVESFEEILLKESVSIYQTKVGERIEEKDSAKWYRKQINTRLSKIKNNEGRRATHIKEMKCLLSGLNIISKKDAEEMSDKIAKDT